MKPFNTIKIGLDFDETVSTNIKVWKLIVKLLQNHNYDVRIVTARPDFGNNDDIKDFAKSCNIEIIYCEGEPKVAICRSINWIPDIWIDDNPINIPEKSEILEWFNIAPVAQLDRA